MAAYRAELRTRVPPGPARGWMFNLTEQDYDHPAFAEAGLRRRRRIVAKGPREVTAEDAYRGQRARTTMRLQGEDAIEVATEGSGLRGQGTIRFLPDDGGARIVYEGTLRGEGAAGILLPALRRSWERALERSEAIHVRAMEEEWDREPWS